jgi:uncharacterized protein YndB with AHSA1/START domain
MTITRTTRSARIESAHVRIDIQQVSPGARLAVRIRPADLPPGVTDGPRVALEFTPADALAFADVLIEQATQMQRATRAFAAEREHRANAAAETRWIALRL